MMAETPLVSIIIPAYNEEDTILKVLSQCVSLLLHKEILVVDNGSTDDTALIIDHAITYNPAFRNVRLLSEPLKGKGNALRKGVANASGSFVVFHDADCEYDPKQIPLIVEALRSSPIVNGCRVGRLYDIGIGPFLANKIFLALITRYFKADLSDILTGQRGFSRNLLNSLELSSSGFEIETEMTLKALMKGLVIRELSVPYEPRDKRSGKKIGARDFIIILSLILTTAFKLRFNRRLHPTRIAHPEA